ncbi:MAG: fatty acid desaturase family protein [Candidatus Binatia bacterium]
MTNRATVTAESIGGVSTGLNLFLAALYVLVNVFQFLILPSWLLREDLRWSLLLLPLAFLTNPFWSLIHEAIHDLLHPNRRLNAIAGRLLAVMFGSPFRILRSSHLLHHKLNRAPAEGTEYYERGKRPVLVAATGYYFQILGGLYLAEIMSPLLFFLPRSAIRSVKERFVDRESVSGILLQSWTRRDSVREIRIDGGLIILLFTLSLICYGSYWPLLVLVLAGRGLLISFLDNVYHYRTPVNDIFYANNLRLPRILAKPMLNFNLHGVHHRNPSVPWKRLPLAFREQAQTYHGNYFAAAARQLAGPTALQDLPGPDVAQCNRDSSIIGQLPPDVEHLNAI